MSGKPSSSSLTVWPVASLCEPVHVLKQLADSVRKLLSGKQLADSVCKLLSGKQLDKA